MEGQALWSTFVEDGSLHAGRIRETLTAGRAAGVAPDAYTIATLALLMGMDELGRLALALERAADDVPPGAAPSPALVEAGRALAAAFHELAHPDASGARTGAEPLARARAALEAGRSAEGPSTTPTSASASATTTTTTTTTGTDDQVFAPAVDDDMVELFFEEATERLEALSQKLLQLEDRPTDGELIRDIFRDLHTIKGSSGMVGLRPMNRLAHAAEDLVGQVRDGTRRAERPVVDALLGSIDGLRAVLDKAIARGPIDVDLAPLVARVKDPSAAPTPAPVVDTAEPATAATAAAAGGPTPAAARSEKHTLRVDFEKLDLLLNLVGELVLSKAGLHGGIQGLGSLARELDADRRLARKAAQGGNGQGPARQAQLVDLGEELGRLERVFQEVAHDLDTSSARLDRVAGELRDQVMKLRMVPIGGVFRKYHRTVRDLGRALGKKVRLELLGEDTELDKILVEQLDDPLMHLVRNAVDHGVEAPEARAAAGKDPEGTLVLSATHRGNQIIIELRDDGGGIDPARVRGKAMEKEIVTRGELDAMDDVAVLDLIFRAGFSTAARVSEVSGRGVGMDVVREAIVTRLKGAVEVASTVGRGTTFTLKLPLTLAIIQVLVVRAAGETFCIPLDLVQRTLACSSADVHPVYDREVLHAGGRQIPAVRLREALELAGPPPQAGDALYAIVTGAAGASCALLVDRLVGKQEIVIKTLGDFLEEVEGAAGATLLGERCALILDVPAVIARAQRQGRSPTAHAAAAAPSPAAGRRRILLVEDSDVIRESLRRLIAAAGFDVVEARDGQEGLARALAEPFDLVSTDVVMPNMDGYELTRALRASERYKNTPIIMVTSRGERIDRVRGFDAGVDEYITKPHDRQELIAAILRHLERGGRA